MKRHQRSSADPSSLLSLFSKTPSQTHNPHNNDHHHHRFDSPLAKRTNRRSADTNTLVDSSLKSQSSSPQTRSSSISPSPKIRSSSISPTPMPNSRQRTLNQERWSVWTADSTLHPDLEEDRQHHDQDMDDPHKTYCTDSHVELNHKPFDVGGRGIGVNMGIEMPHNRCSIASTSSRSTASSIQSSAVSPYTPCSVDSQPVMGICGQPTGVPPASAGQVSHSGRSCPSPYCQAGEEDDDDEEEEDEEGDEQVNAALDAALSSTMLALEAANSLLVSTMSSRTHLARLRAAEHALDVMMTDRERELLRQIDSNRQMVDHMDRVCGELQDMARSFPSTATLSLSNAGKRAWTPMSTGSSTAEARVSVDPKLGGIVEALDENATVGKTAAKRLERMLKGDADNLPSSSSSGSRIVSPATSSKDARSLLSAFAASSASPTSATTEARSVSDSASTTSTKTKRSTPSRRSSHSQLSGSIPPRPSVLAGRTHRSSPSAPMLHHASSSSAIAVSPVDTEASISRPPFTRGKSSLSQAFGMQSGSSGISDGLPSSSDEPAPITPEQRTFALPETDESTGLDAESEDPRRISTGHARSPSVIKPSTASSALVSPDVSEWNQWRITEEHNPSTSPDTPQSIIRGHGALAALRSLNSQTSTSTPKEHLIRPPSLSSTSSHRVTTNKTLSGSTSSSPPFSRKVSATDTPTSNDTNADSSYSTTTTTTTTKGWTLSGWMKFNNNPSQSSQSNTPIDGITAKTVTPTLVNSSSMGSIIEHQAQE